MTNNGITSTDTTIALVTGANKGLGRETVRRLAQLGWTVLLAARDQDLGIAAASELASEGDVRPVVVDVTDQASVDAARNRVRDQFGRLDVLVNNAGIAGSRLPVEETGAADFLACFGVNVLGPVRMTQAFLPLLRASSHPCVVMVSSGMGSLAVTSDPNRIESTIHGLVYPSSKSALNMIMSQYARALPDIQINAADPGYTATDLNGHSGFQSVHEGTDAIVTLATAGQDGPTGGFYDRAGAVPW